MMTLLLLHQHCLKHPLKLMIANPVMSQLSSTLTVIQATKMQVMKMQVTKMQVTKMLTLSWVLHHSYNYTGAVKKIYSH